MQKSTASLFQRLIPLAIAILMGMSTVGPALAATSVEVTHSEGSVLVQGWADPDTSDKTGASGKDDTFDAIINKKWDTIPDFASSLTAENAKTPSDANTNITLAVDPCFGSFNEGWAPGHPAAFREIDTLTYSGAGPNPTKPFIIRDEATDIVVALYGETTSSKAAATISNFAEGLVGIECAKETNTFDYAVVSFPLNLFPNVDDNNPLVRIEDGGVIVFVPTFIDWEHNRIYAVTTDFCVFCDLDSTLAKIGETYTAIRDFGINRVFQIFGGFLKVNETESAAVKTRVGYLVDDAVLRIPGANLLEFQSIPECRAATLGLLLGSWGRETNCTNFKRIAERNGYFFGDFLGGFVPVIGQVKSASDIICYAQAGKPVDCVFSAAAFAPGGKVLKGAPLRIVQFISKDGRNVKAVVQSATIRHLLAAKTQDGVEISLYAGKHVGEHAGFGLEHIISQHGEELAAEGITKEEQIVKIIEATITQGTWGSKYGTKQDNFRYLKLGNDEYFFIGIGDNLKDQVINGLKMSNKDIGKSLIKINGVDVTSRTSVEALMKEHPSVNWAKVIDLSKLA